ncbi:MAG: hypothetical protein DRH24_16270 [Deltaproteobacteria bacterium]|nr:MAG: hypothetical protein DRH24_16270 [Deltaproteobacteria bacterium]
MTEKPKPLDLNLERLVEEWSKREYWITRDEPDLEAMVEHVIRRIKSACEFYLRYKNRPGLLREEHPQLFERIPEVSGASCKNCKYLGSDSGTECFWYVCNHPHFLSIDVETPTVPPLDQNRRPIWCPLDLEGYNNWLFKLAFKSVLEDKR